MVKRKFIIIGAIVAVIAGTLIFAYYSNTPNSSNSPNPIPTTKKIVFDEESLVNNGVTSGQINNLEQALEQYLISQNKSPHQVSFSSLHRMPPDPKISTPFSEITFTIWLDSKASYKAKLDSFGLSEIRLYLYNLGDNTLLYDSQNIGGSSS